MFSFSASRFSKNQTPINVIRDEQSSNCLIVSFSIQPETGCSMQPTRGVAIGVYKPHFLLAKHHHSNFSLECTSFCILSSARERVYSTMAVAANKVFIEFYL